LLKCVIIIVDGITRPVGAAKGKSVNSSVSFRHQFNGLEGVNVGEDGDAAQNAAAIVKMAERVVSMEEGTWQKECKVWCNRIL
jgi:hypothetical protein